MTNNELTMTKDELIYLVEKEFDITVKEINALNVTREDEIKVAMTISGDCEFLKHFNFYTGIMLKSNLFYNDMIDAFVGTINLRFMSSEIGPLTSKDNDSLLYILYHPNLKAWEIISHTIYQQRVKKLRELIRKVLGESGFIEL
jgi:hypothetical protein